VREGVGDGSSWLLQVLAMVFEGLTTEIESTEKGGIVRSYPGRIILA
jgi:hypothetical protein